jgi:TolA-binding protein
MKKYFISMFLLVSISGFAMPNKISKTEKKVTTSTISTVESNAVVSMKQLQDENIQLKQQMMNLSNENEELKGLISFQTMMQKIFLHIDAQKKVEETEELKALIGYNNMMYKVVQVLQNTTTK